MGRSRKNCVSKGPGQGPARALAGSATAPAGHRQARTHLAGARAQGRDGFDPLGLPRELPACENRIGEPKSSTGEQAHHHRATAAPKMELAGSERPSPGAHGRGVAYRGCCAAETRPPPPPGLWQRWVINSYAPCQVLCAPHPVPSANAREVVSTMIVQR